MAHVAKYTRSAAGRLFLHNLRGKDANGNYVLHGKSRITPALTQFNYRLDDGGDPTEKLEKRLGEVKVQNRADVKVYCSWVITKPTDGSIEFGEDPAFFRSCYRFLCQEYGAENVVMACVHLDETTPHMHFGFIPATIDKKHPERMKVSAKEVLTRKHLKDFHKRLRAFVEKDLGHRVGIVADAKVLDDDDDLKKPYKSLKELRAETAKAQAEVDRLEKLREEARKVSVPAAVLENQRLKVQIAQQKKVIDDLKKRCQFWEAIAERLDQAGQLGFVALQRAWEQIKEIVEKQLGYSDPRKPKTPQKAPETPSGFER